MTGKYSAKNMPPEDNKPEGKKLLLFKAFSILFPIVILFGLELILRLFNYGNNTDLFVKYPPDQRFMVMNYSASDKFFSDTITATKGNQEIFAINKSPNTVRIFVLGESTTIGFPFRPNGSFHRWLQYRLMQMYPEKNFEVINLSLTAVNSYTVLDFGKQLHKYQPDAVLIYTGHNEYYGALGIGSTNYVGSNRFLVKMLIRLKEFRLVQLLNNSIRKVTGLFADKNRADNRSLMEVMAARQHIVYRSADYQAGIDQFDKNMTELCSTLNNEKIPVFLSTVVSNEKDQPPFISAGSGPESAAWYYNAGQLALKNLDYVTAKKDFDKAKELDQLRFRAPEAINSSVRNIATRFPYVHLVDSKKMFEQHSPNGITGHETITEHVHPNLLGYAIMSDAFFQAIQKQNLVKGTPERNISLEQLLKEMPITKMDSAMGLYQVMMLKTGWPFNQPISKQFKVGNSMDETMAVKVALGHMFWTSALGQLYSYDKKQGNNQGALKIAEAMVLQYPQSGDFYGYAAGLNADLKNYEQAAFYYTKLFMLNKDQATAQTAFSFYLKADDPEHALAMIKDIPPQYQTKTRTMLTKLINDKINLKNKPKDSHLQQQVYADYKLLGIADTTFQRLKKSQN